MKKQEYAVYKGDNFIFLGTLDEICERFNVKRSTAHYWGTPRNKRKALQHKQYSGHKIMIKV